MFQFRLFSVFLDKRYFNKKYTRILEFYVALGNPEITLNFLYNGCQM